MASFRFIDALLRGDRWAVRLAIETIAVLSITGIVLILLAIFTD